MKQYPPFLTKLRHVVLPSIAAMLLILSAINCGPPPQGEYHVPETALAAAERNTTPERVAQNEVNLPQSATVELQRQPYVKNAFKETLRPNSRSGLDDFYVTSRQNVQHSAIISNCSLDILKAFVAKGWAPIVMVQLQGRTPEILPISDYNDHTSEIHLHNPNSSNKRRLSYEEFETAWTKSSRNKCIVITPQQLRDTDLQNVLRRYLPADTFQNVSMRSR